MRKLVLLMTALAGAASAQYTVDANAIVVMASNTVVLTPTEASFMLNVSADMTITLEQVLTALDFGLTAQDLTGIGSYPIGPYPTNYNRLNYSFRLSVPFAQMKETVEKLEKLRKTLDSGMDLNYSSQMVGPSAAAFAEARDKALPELMSEARKRAEVLASAAQLKLGAIKGVTEAYGSPSGVGPLPANVSFNVMVRFDAQ